jgi:hypothetical protein
MVTRQGNLAVFAVQLFSQEVASEDARRAENPMTLERAQKLAQQTGSTSEAFFESRGIFSGIKEGIGIGRWDNSTAIFDVESGDLFTAYRGCGGVVVYRATDLVRRFKEGEDVTSRPGPLGEFLFGSGSMEVALGSYRVDALETAILSPEETEDLFARLRVQDIDPENYLV